jgi:serine/threonine protein kinase
VVKLAGKNNIVNMSSLTIISGAFSVVKKATRREDGKEVAVKIINKFKHRHDLDLIRDEVAVMRAVKGHIHGKRTKFVSHIEI